MDDSISRQAAIDAVCMEWCGVKHQDCKHPFDFEKDDYFWCDGCETALRTLPELPSVQPEVLACGEGELSAEPERKKGKWAGKGDSEGFGIFICGTCGKFAMMKSNFCPNCGADMR